MKALILILTLSGCFKWTKTDTVLEITSQGTLVADWYTTHRGLNAGLEEQNPVMGPAGDRLSPNVYFPLTMLLHAGISAVLPTTARRVFQGLTIGMQSVTVHNNWVNIQNAEKSIR